MFPIDKELKPEMSTLTQTSEFVRRSLRLAVAMSVVCGAGVAVAQTSAAPAQGQVTAPQVNFNAYTTLPATYAAVSDSSSSSSDTDTTAVASVPTDPLHLNAMQYGGRQRRRRPTSPPRA